MAFLRINGCKGMLYVPEDGNRQKKHPCTDCFSCSFCSDERCGLCLKEKSEPGQNNCICEKSRDHIQGNL